MMQNSISDTKSLNIMPKVVVGGIIKSIARLTANAVKRDIEILNQNDLNSSIVIVLYIV